MLLFQIFYFTPNFYFALNFLFYYEYKIYSEFLVTQVEGADYLA